MGARPSLTGRASAVAARETPRCISGTRHWSSSGAGEENRRDASDFAKCAIGASVHHRAVRQINASQAG